MTQPTKFSFTKEGIMALPLPAAGRVTYHDTHKLGSGLQLRITANGTKTFCVFRRVLKGQPERITLGRYPDLTIEQARRQAAKINVAIGEGANPAAVKRAHKAEHTFSHLFEEFIERHAKLKKRTWAEDVQRFDQYLRLPLGSKKLASLDRKAIAAVHSGITAAGHPTVANRVLALVSSVFGWAIDAGLANDNPAKGIRRNRETSRDRFLQEDELPRFFDALALESNEVMRHYFFLSLLTGARRANMLSMRWEDINLGRAEWRIDETKNGTPQVVTLSPQAVEILKSMKLNATSPFVFPGSGKSGHIKEPRKAWSRLLQHAELKDLKIHDLRRTLGSWQAKSGASLAIIGKSLNHKNVATTAIYARLDQEPVRASVNLATAAMLAAGRTTSPSTLGGAEEVVGVLEAVLSSESGLSATTADP